MQIYVYLKKQKLREEILKRFSKQLAVKKTLKGQCHENFC